MQTLRLISLYLRNRLLALAVVGLLLPMLAACNDCTNPARPCDCTITNPTSGGASPSKGGYVLYGKLTSKDGRPIKGANLRVETLSGSIIGGLESGERFYTASGMYRLVIDGTFSHDLILSAGLFCSIEIKIGSQDGENLDDPLAFEPATITKQGNVWIIHKDFVFDPSLDEANWPEITFHRLEGRGGEFTHIPVSALSENRRYNSEAQLAVTSTTLELKNSPYPAIAIIYESCVPPSPPPVPDYGSYDEHYSPVAFPDRCYKLTLVGGRPGDGLALMGYCPDTRAVKLTDCSSLSFVDTIDLPIWTGGFFAFGEKGREVYPIFALKVGDQLGYLAMTNLSTDREDNGYSPFFYGDFDAVFRSRMFSADQTEIPFEYYVEGTP